MRKNKIPAPKLLLILLIAMAVCVLLLGGLCIAVLMQPEAAELAAPVTEPVQQTEETSLPETTEPETTVPETTEPQPVILPVTEPVHAVLEPKWWMPMGPNRYTRDQIASITFLNTVAGAPADAWDVSAARDGAIMAWTSHSVLAEGLEDLFIGSDTEIFAGESLSFTGFTHLQKLNFSGLLNTSELTSCAGMFEETGVLSGTGWELDLSGWDVSHVQNMGAMFSGCRTLTAVNLSGWDVSAVTECTDMFFGCKELQQLEIGGWKLAPGCTTDRMLHGCKSLPNVQELSQALNLTPELTQADFPNERFTELTAAELKWVAENAVVAPAPATEEWTPVYVGDIGQCIPAYSNLDLDRDGRTDTIWHVAAPEEGVYTYELHFGSGQVLPLEITDSTMGIYYCEFFFGDMNQSGKDDILAVSVSVAQGAGGRTVDFALFTDMHGKYYRQTMQNLECTMEDLQNGYVRLSCPTRGYREIIPFGYSPWVMRRQTETSSDFEYFFGGLAVRGKVDRYRPQDVKLDGNKLIVLYNFYSVNGGYLSSNPFAVEWRLAPGGYFMIDRIGTDVIQDYWLSE